MLCFALKGRLENLVIMGVLTTCCYVACSIGGKPVREHGLADVTEGDNSLIDNACRRCDPVVASRGPMGQLSNRLPTACGLAL